LEDFSIGGDFTYQLNERKEDDKFLKCYNFGLTYNADNLLLAAIVEKSFSNAILGVKHTIDRETELGFEFSHKLSEKKI